jgi:hypothetical protein
MKSYIHHDTNAQASQKADVVQICQSNWDLDVWVDVGYETG